MLPGALGGRSTLTSPTGTAPGTARAGTATDRPFGDVVVAAADARSRLRTRADMVCDGVSDEVELQRALDLGGRVVLTEGTFSLSAGLVRTQPSALSGQGRGLTRIVGNGSVMTLGQTVFLTDVTLEGFSAVQTGAGTDGSGWALLQGVEITRAQSAPRTSVVFGQGVSAAAQVTVVDSTFDHCYVRVDAFGVVDGCDFTDCLVWLQKGVLSGCGFVDCGLACGKRELSLPFTTVAVRHCRITGSPPPPPSDPGPHPTRPLSLVRTKAATVIGNLVDATGGDLVFECRDANASVTGNLIRGLLVPTVTNPAVVSILSAEALVLAANLLEGASASPASDSAAVWSDSRVLVRGNVIRNSGAGSPLAYGVDGRASFGRLYTVHNDLRNLGGRPAWTAAAVAGGVTTLTGNVLS